MLVKNDHGGGAEREGEEKGGERKYLIVIGQPKTNHLCYRPVISWGLSTARVLNPHVVVSKKNF